MPDSETERLAMLEERLKSNADRIDRLERLADEVHAQNENIARLVVRLELADALMHAYDRRLTDLEAQPKLRINTILGAIIAALASAVIGGLLSMIFR